MNPFFYKQTTRESYDQTASEYERNVDLLLPLKEAEKFLTLLPRKGTILDIGCGPGRDALFFTERGFSVTGIDFSPAMIERARQKSPKAKFEVMDIEEMDFPIQSFDGAWANASLLHIAKEKFPFTLQTIHRLLRPSGILYLFLKKGSGEGIAKDKRYGDKEKFWSFFDEEELLKLIEKAHFELLEKEVFLPRNTYETHPTIQLFCKKRLT